jgi:serine/threonine protein kinase
MEPVLLNNRYRLLEMVGSGGMAIVYKGVDTLLERPVAVKVLREAFASDPAFLARFQREARAAAKLDHPNVVTVYDVGQDGDRHYIVMEYVDGQDLKTLIRQKSRLSLDETLDIITQVCAGVGHAHQAGLIHCDIKPQNVLVTPGGRAKVTDFGIARALSEADLTESETVWGSPTYFAPEQAAGEPPTPASDVYSIGVMMYEMLAGTPPFHAEKVAALALKHMREEPPPLVARNPQVPPQVEAIVWKVLAKEPGARYQTAEHLAHALEAYRRRSEQMTGWQPAIPSDSMVPPAPPPELLAAPRWLTWGLGAVALVAVVGLIPLALSVRRAYSPTGPSPRPTHTPTPAVTVTPAVELIAVPDVLQMPEDEARERLERDGFSVRLEARDVPGTERGRVLEQRPNAGELIQPHSEVTIVVSRAPRDLTMVDVVGYSADEVQDGLESDGLHVAIEEVWSTEPKGAVTAQEPEPGTTIHAGDTVTLTVSGGFDVPIPIEANLADLIVLKSVELPQATFRPGAVATITLHWYALHSPDKHYIVFTHLIDPDDPDGPSSVTLGDAEPYVPTSQWTAGAQIAAPHQITIPLYQPAGRYHLRVGMYEGPHRLPVVDAGLTTAESDSILIAEVEIRP